MLRIQKHCRDEVTPFQILTTSILKLLKWSLINGATRAVVTRGELTAVTLFFLQKI